jgi:O-acetylhomoserine/O-acetylserine sulfhydrylase-like pyridoxal-dependent enzyme
MRFILTASLVLGLLLVGSSLVFAQSTQQYYSGPGGAITGMVIGVDGHPFDWATIYASNNQQTFEAFSGMSGVYQMRVPSGTYNVTVSAHEYTANGATVTVTDNSSNTVNFYLQQTVPEFQPMIEPLLMAFTIVLVFFIFKRTNSNAMLTI